MTLDEVSIGVMKKYPDLWECLVHIERWTSIEKYLDYPYFHGLNFHERIDHVSSQPENIWNYISQNEHLHEEWIVRIKYEML